MQPEARDREDVGARFRVLPVDLLDELGRVEEGLGAPERRRKRRAAAREVGAQRRVEDERRPGAEAGAEILAGGLGTAGPPGRITSRLLAFRPMANRSWALVLGASSGFGEGTSLALARAGRNVFGVHLDRKATLPNVERITGEIAAGGAAARLLQHERRGRREAGRGDRRDGEDPGRRGDAGRASTSSSTRSRSARSSRSSRTRRQTGSRTPRWT